MLNRLKLKSNIHNLYMTSHLSFIIVGRHGRSIEMRSSFSYVCFAKCRCIVLYISSQYAKHAVDCIYIEKEFWICWNIDFPINVNVLRIVKDVFFPMFDNHIDVFKWWGFESIKSSQDSSLQLGIGLHLETYSSWFSLYNAAFHVDGFIGNIKLEWKVSSFIIVTSSSIS